MKVAVLFSGQGAQCPEMMEEIFAENPCAQALFDKAQHIIGRDLHELVLNGTQEQLDETINTQPCILACELAGWRIYRQLGFPADAVTGFSLGEWAALVASGAATEDDILGLIDTRALAMQRAVPLGDGGMAAMLGKDNDFVAEYCRSIGEIAPAIFNCAGNVTVAGKAYAVDRFCEKAENDEILYNRVAISIPAHCSLMQPAVEELRPLISSLPLTSPNKKLIMNATGNYESDVDAIRNNMILQLSNPVRFHQTIQLLLNDGYDTFVEIGPGKVLTGLVRRTAKADKRKVQVFQFNCAEGIEKLNEHMNCATITAV